MADYLTNLLNGFTATPQTDAAQLSGATSPLALADQGTTGGNMPLDYSQMMQMLQPKPASTSPLSTAEPVSTNGMTQPAVDASGGTTGGNMYTDAGTVGGNMPAPTTAPTLQSLLSSTEPLTIADISAALHPAASPSDYIIPYAMQNPDVMAAYTAANGGDGTQAPTNAWQDFSQNLYQSPEYQQFMGTQQAATAALPDYWQSDAGQQAAYGPDYAWEQANPTAPASQAPSLQDRPAPTDQFVAAGQPLQQAPADAPAPIGSTGPIDWSAPQYQQSIRTVMGDPNNDPAKISQAMRDWGVSNDAFMKAMGWNQNQFDNYFAELFGPKDSIPGAPTAGPAPGSPPASAPGAPTSGPTAAPAPRQVPYVPAQVRPRTVGGSPFVPSDAVPGKYGSFDLANKTGSSSLQALIDTYQAMRTNQQAPLSAVSSLK